MMRYAPLADTRLVAAVFGFPAYAAQPTRRERVSRRGPSGAGERVARALTQERAPRTLRRLQAGKPQRPDAGPGNGSRAVPTREASPAMGSLPRRPDRSTQPGSTRPIEPQSVAAGRGQGAPSPQGGRPPTPAPSGIRVRLQERERSAE